MPRALTKLFFWLFLLFILPALASLGWWSMVERPASWNLADWSSSGILPAAGADSQAVIHVLSARTGGMKGALSQHSWIVLKKSGASNYDRYDKVGWGSPVRKNGYAADARWYSNQPGILKTVKGRQAERLIPEIEAAIAAYPHAEYGGYGLWPGPNSNSFIAHVLRKVPELDMVLPANAVGRDYLTGGKWVHFDQDNANLQVSLLGYGGFSIGSTSGIELNFLGLVAGINFREPGLKLPGFGDVAVKDLATGTAFAR